MDSKNGWFIFCWATNHFNSRWNVSFSADRRRGNHSLKKKIRSEENYGKIVNRLTNNDNSHQLSALRTNSLKIVHLIFFPASRTNEIWMIITQKAIDLHWSCQETQHFCPVYSRLRDACMGVTLLCLQPVDSAWFTAHHLSCFNGLHCCCRLRRMPSPTTSNTRRGFHNSLCVIFNTQRSLSPLAEELNTSKVWHSETACLAFLCSECQKTSWAAMGP